MEDKNIFGKILKEIRKENGDSFRKLEDKSGVTFSYIDQIERGKAPINKGTLEKFLKVYPLYKQRLLKAYLEEVLPDSIQKDLNLKIEDNFLDNMKDIIKMLDKESQKLAFLYIIERLEYTSLKNGTYDKVKNMLDKVKEKIEKQ